MPEVSYATYYGSTTGEGSLVVTNGEIVLPIIRGDDYLAANNRAFEWNITKPTGFSLVGASARFVGCATILGKAYEWNVTGTITEVDETTLKISFDLPGIATADLADGKYDWAAWISNTDGVRITAVHNENRNYKVLLRSSP